MTGLLETAACGPYEVVAQQAGSLVVRADGSVQLQAELPYLVRLGEGADPMALTGALTVLKGASEGELRFGNFIGQTELGGRRLDVISRRLPGAAVEHMIDEVAAELASLPFAARGPTFAPYVRQLSVGPDALFHAFAFVRDAMAGRGPHDLSGSVQRILQRPFESLVAEGPRLVPLGLAQSFDSTTLMALQSEPELLTPVHQDSPLAAHPLAQQLHGRLPEFIRTRPVRHSTNNRENQFVVAALELMSDLARRFERLARESNSPPSATNGREAAAIAATLQRWRQHPSLEHTRSSRHVPLQSTVLRGRPGYRELLKFYLELLARTGLAEPHDLHALLELRDAATIYEYWCFFQVVNAVAAVVGEKPTRQRIPVKDEGALLPWSYQARWPQAEVLFNRSFSRPSSGPPELGHHSYSLRLRPDIVVRGQDDRLHLFDAKLKVHLAEAVASGVNDQVVSGQDGFKSDDLHKMHAYRDALGAVSVWVLYPGSNRAPVAYPSFGGPDIGNDGFRGVGAIALKPGAGHDGGLAQLVAAIVGVAKS